MTVHLTTINIALLLASTVALGIGAAAMVLYWKTEGSSHIAFVHLSITVLIAFVAFGSWGTLLASPTVAMVDPSTGSFIGAIGRGALLTLSIYIPLLWVYAMPRRKKGA